MNNDLIRREALKKHKVYSEERHEYIVPVYDIDNAPTVEPPEWQFEFVKMLYEKARQQGKWIFNKLTGDTICSRCRRTRRDTRKEHIYFCNHCGARMITASEVDNDNQL